jgi:hypothetical protein
MITNQSPSISFSREMKTSPRSLSMTAPQCSVSFFAGCVVLLVLGSGASIAVHAADTARTFATPEDAVAALVAVTNSTDGTALQTVFGPAATELENPDHVQAANDRSAFAAALKQGTRIVPESDSRCVLEVGDDFWPFPVPIVRQDGRWFFDVAAAKDELLSRRIGRNELMTLRVVRAYVAAQREYAAQDRDGDEVLEFAQKIMSTADSKDGLYWPPELDGEISPLGPLVARAQEQGFELASHDPATPPEPFHGYLFKILIRQGPHAPGGRYDYVINGNMIAGFALVAWPAHYGESGVMTFVVNQQGRVHERDLGPETVKSIEAMTEYDPDPLWGASAD